MRDGLEDVTLPWVLMAWHLNVPGQPLHRRGRTDSPEESVSKFPFCPHVYSPYPVASS